MEHKRVKHQLGRKDRRVELPLSFGNLVMAAQALKELKEEPMVGCLCAETCVIGIKSFQETGFEHPRPWKELYERLHQVAIKVELNQTVKRMLVLAKADVLQIKLLSERTSSHCFN